jgi:septal ring factor EnvC (AmiA/AmiB activator)
VSATLERVAPPSVWLLLLPCLVAGAALAATPQRTEAQLRALRARIEQMTRQVSRDALRRDRASAQLRAAELSVGQARDEVTRLGREYSDRSERRSALDAARASQQRSLEEDRRALAADVRAAWLLGRGEPLRLLFATRDPLEHDRLANWYGYLGRARARRILDIGEHVRRLDELDGELSQQQMRLASLSGAQQSQLQQLERARHERQRVLASLESVTHSREQSLVRLKVQQADLERLLSKLNRSLESSPPPDAASAFGRLRGRLDWPVNGHLTALLDERRAPGVRWDGLVVATERGAQVRAVSAGRIVYADWLPGLGLLAIVDHGQGYLSLYGHNERLFKGVGAGVAAGEVIAAAGDSGGRPSPELYFEIRHAGRPVDPRPWFRERHPGP